MSQLECDSPDFDRCLESAVGSSLEPVFTQAVAKKSLPDYWKALLLDVSNFIAVLIISSFGSTLSHKLRVR